MANIDLITDVDKGANATVTVEVFEDVGADGSGGSTDRNGNNYETSKSTTVGDGQNTNTLSGFDANEGNDYWVDITFSNTKRDEVTRVKSVDVQGSPTNVVGSNVVQLSNTTPEPAFATPLRDGSDEWPIAQLITNDTTTDINVDGVLFPWNAIEALNKDFYSFNKSGHALTFQKDGTYKAKVTVGVEGSVTDASPAAHLELDGTRISGEAAGNYISNSNGHTKSSSTFTAFIQAKSGQVLKTVMSKRGAAGTVNPETNLSVLNIRRLRRI